MRTTFLGHVANDHLGATLNAGPIRALATFDLEATREEGSKLVLVAIRPVELKQQPAKVPQAA